VFTARYGLNIKCNRGYSLILKRDKLEAVKLKVFPWVRGLGAGLATRRPGFDPGLVLIRFMVDRSAQGQVSSSEYFGFSLSLSFQHCCIHTFM
jgi:hypothetical protein